MKRTWIMFCILTLVATMFAGCGNSKPAAEETTKGGETTTQASKDEEGKPDFENKELNIAVFEGGFGRAYWEEVISRFEQEYPGVKVNMTSNPKIMDIIKPQIVAGNPPDLIYAPMTDNTGTIQTMIKEKALLELNDVFDSTLTGESAPLKDKMVDGILNYAAPHGDGKIVVAPFNISTLGMWYNADLFEKKGWKAPETWDELFAMHDTAQQDGRFLFTYQGIYPTYNDNIVFPSIASAGGQQAIEDVASYKEGAFQSDAVRKVFGLFDTIAQKGYLMPGTVAMNHTQAQTEFLKGKALFIPNGSWFEGEMKDAPREEGFRFGFMAPPIFNKGDDRYALTVYEGLFIPKKAKNPELAKEFIKFQYRDDSIKLNAEKTTGIVAVKNASGLVKDFVPESVYNSIKIFEEGVKPLIFQWNVTPKTEININKEMFDAISSVMNKDMTVEQWIERMEGYATKLRELSQ